MSNQEPLIAVLTRFIIPVFGSGFSESEVPDAMAESRKEGDNVDSEERLVPSRDSSAQNDPDSAEEDYFSDEDIDMVRMLNWHCVYHFLRFHLPVTYRLSLGSMAL
jgi:hypothetical protein